MRKAALALLVTNIWHHRPSLHFTFICLVSGFAINFVVKKKKNMM